MFNLTFAHLLSYDAGAPGINLDVELRLNNAHVAFKAKLDTGASCSIFSRRHGETLGLDVESGLRQTFGTAIGTFVAYGHDVTLRIADITFDGVVYFAADENFDRDVIGRFGGLDHLKIGVVDYEGKLYLSRYGEE